MWYEILPGMAIMAACLSVPGLATVFVQRWSSGGKEKRVARYPYQWALMQRDKRLSGGSKHYEAKAGAGGIGSSANKKNGLQPSGRCQSERQCINTKLLLSL
uniref:NADH dehydrogenase [ubiquinone] 1 alpha subcomplex subunit 1 n=1 Tax=Cairina moschata TaxID=8855 RepID=A0A8C3B884_CAIMO